MCILPGPMSFSGIMSLSLSCLPPNKQTQSQIRHKVISCMSIRLINTLKTIQQEWIVFLPLSISGRVLSSYPPLLRVLLGGLRLTMKSVFFQPSFSSVRRSSLKPHTICSTSPAPRTSRSERLLYGGIQTIIQRYNYGSLKSIC